ncbi:MAG TPA: serine hydrolase [Gammaproteobacteria bacterium]|nr:serine hydrolase [Gammaproteobacteria bacterium]
MITRTALPALLLACSTAVFAQAPAAPAPNPRDTDPVKLGWMVGSPPPADKMIRASDGSSYRFPQWRWSFSHWRELVPTVEVARGLSPVNLLIREERTDLDAVTFVPMGGGAPMTWGDSLVANYTDGIVVLHRGRIVYERYFGALKAEGQHIAFSVTKSFFGTIAATLIAEGKLDASSRVDRYIPELKDSGFGDATVAQVLDMTTALDFVEDYTGASPTMNAYRAATGFDARTRPEQAGPSSIYEFLPTIKKQGTHGTEFHYRTPNSDVVGWLIARVTNKSPAEVLSERIWSKLGAEKDAFLQVDANGTPLVGTSLNPRLRDLARFGEMMRLGGRYNGQDIVPKKAIEEITRGGSREAFVFGNYSTLQGWSYKDQWWVSHDDHGVFMARGIHGQAIYVDPAAEMVIARFASHPLAANVNLDPLSLPAYRAIADRLMAPQQ